MTLIVPHATIQWYNKENMFISHIKQRKRVFVVGHVDSNYHHHGKRKRHHQ